MGYYVIFISNISYKESRTKSIVLGIRKNKVINYRKLVIIMKKVAFHTLGCKVNTYETEAMSSIMQAAGYGIVDFSEKADIYIINTCSVTNIADKKSRQMLHKAKKENPEAIIVAVGCYVQSAAEKLKADENIDIIVGNNKKKEIADIINDYLNIDESESHIIDINAAREYEELIVSKMSGHTRAFIKIQDGCNQFCTYCIIPYTRGRVRSRDKNDILKEANQLAEAGYRELVLTGIHISSYGIDLKDDISLIDVIKELACIEGIERIRVGSLEPRVITEDFLEELIKIKKFCPHFHLSLQSGSDATLKRMNRRYTTEQYKNGVELIRKYYKSAAITTDIIAGFPGETEEEFLETLDFVKSIEFFETHIFPYSKREGTPAADMPGQISQKEKSKRAKKLSDIYKENMKKFIDARIGNMDEILLEEELKLDGVKYMVGHTKEYVKVAIRYIENTKNKLVSGKISSYLTSDVLFIDKIVDIL